MTAKSRGDPGFLLSKLSADSEPRQRGLSREMRQPASGNPIHDPYDRNQTRGPPNKHECRHSTQNEPQQPPPERPDDPVDMTGIHGAYGIAALKVRQHKRCNGR